MPEKCKPIKFILCRAFLRRDVFTDTQASFDELINKRNYYFKLIRKKTKSMIRDDSIKLWRELVDEVNVELNMIRNNETPLCPAKFIRSSYSTA